MYLYVPKVTFGLETNADAKYGSVKKQVPLLQPYFRWLNII